MNRGEDSDLLNSPLLFLGQQPPAAFVSSPDDFENLSDTQLLKFFKEGTRSQRQDAFNTIYNRYRMDMFLIISSKGIPLDVAKDLFAEAWSIFSRRLPQFVINDTEEPFKRFLISTVSTLCAKHFRITTEHDEVPLESVLETLKDEPAPDADISPQNARLLQKYAAKLGKRDHQIFSLHIHKRDDYAAIGAKLNMTPGAVRTAWHRIVKKLKRMHDKERNND